MHLDEVGSGLAVGSSLGLPVPSRGINFNCCYRVLPGNRPRALLLREGRREAKRGNCILEGPTQRFSLKWLFASYEGLIWLQTYFWLLKDWSWSQLHWFYSGMIYGSLAVFLATYLVIGALRRRAYSEASIAFGSLLWIASNYWLMIGVFYSYLIGGEQTKPGTVPSLFARGFSLETSGNEYELADHFYETHDRVAKILSLLATGWLTFTIFILPWFYMDRDSEFLTRVNNNAPRYPFKWFFRDFMEFDSSNLVFWSLNDTSWVFEKRLGYVLGFVVTFTMMSSTIYIIATTKGNWINLFNYVAVLWWILANGVWATGELFVEAEHAAQLPRRAYEKYRFFPVDREYIRFFWGRNAAGWCYCMAVVTLVLSYVYWVCFAKFDQSEKTDGNLGVEKKLNGNVTKVVDEVDPESLCMTKTNNNYVNTGEEGAIH